MSKNKPVEEMTRAEARAEWDRLRVSLPSKPPKADECEGGPAEVAEWRAAEFRLFLLAIRAGNFDPEVMKDYYGEPSHPTRTSEQDKHAINQVAKARARDIAVQQKAVRDRSLSMLNIEEREEHADLTTARRALALLRALTVVEGVTPTELVPAAILVAGLLQAEATRNAAETAEACTNRLEEALEKLDVRISGFARR